MTFQQISEPVATVFIALVGTFVVTAILREKLKQRRLRRSLATRPQYVDDQFGRVYFSDAKRADIAVRVRRVLSKNLGVSLDGASPDDRLNEDLNAELAANPHLFWGLEEEFGIKTDVENLDAFEKTLEKLITFGDLVEYVAAKMDQPADGIETPEAVEPAPRLYDYAIRTIPVLCIGGFVVAVTGAVIGGKLLLRVGIGLFLSGFAVWGLANGGGFVWKLVQSIRKQSLKEITAHPWWLLFYTALTLFFLWVGGMFVWMLLKFSFHAH